MKSNAARRRAVSQAGLLFALLCLLSVAGVVPAYPAIVAAQVQSCAEVVDESGQIDVAEVTAEAMNLPPDVQVLVRAYDPAPGGLDAAVDELIATCTSATGKYVVVAIDVSSNESRVDGGPNTGISNSIAEEVRTGPMSDALRSGDLTGGLVAALIDLDVRLKEASSSVGVEDAPTSNDASNPAVPIAVGGILAGGVVVGGGALLVSRRRKLTDRRNALSAKVSEPLVQMGAARERAIRLAERDDRFEHSLAGRTLDTFREHQADVRNEGNDAERAVSLLNQATPEGIGKAKDAQITDAEARLAEFESALERYALALDGFTAFGELLDRLRVSLPAKQELLLDELRDGGELAGQRRQEGWNVTGPEQQLQLGKAALTQLDTGALKMDLLELSEQVEQIEAELFAARHDLQSLPDKLKNLVEWSERLAASAADEHGRIDSTDVSFAEETGLHASDSWRFAADNGDTARKHLGRSGSIRDEATGHPLNAQNWDAVSAGLEQAGLELIAADAVMDEVDGLLVDLRQARLEAPAMLVAAREELAELQRFVREHAWDLGAKFQMQPSEIEAVLAEMHYELQTQRPNHLRVARTLDRLDRQMDVILAQAEDEAARVAALRREVAREVARADRAIQRAEQTLGWSVFSTEKRDLDVLERQLRNLPDALEDQLHVAREIADDAVALRERIILRRRRNNTWIVVGGSGGWGGGNRSGGGWGGSSGGGGGFFGGGGGSFGGGSFGGGSFGGGGGFGGSSSGSW